MKALQDPKLANPANVLENKVASSASDSAPRSALLRYTQIDIVSCGTNEKVQVFRLGFFVIRVRKRIGRKPRIFLQFYSVAVLINSACRFFVERGKTYHSFIWYGRKLPICFRNKMQSFVPLISIRESITSKH